MGKKVKEEKKAPANDTFDPLNVETQQPSTVVLMLESKEEDVLATACEALFKYLEKCDENKQTLMDLGAVDHLLRLIQHEDRIVRRNASLALGLMSGSANVRKMLRKREDCISSVVQLLSPEEDALCHEFAAMILGNLALEYSSKVAILEGEGMESLIRGLTSADPDVQKNCVEGIGLLLMDYQARAAVRTLGGISPLLELLHSDYPVIQEFSLVALERVVTDAENRAAFRELDGLSKLIEFIGSPEVADLHVWAVVVLATCLEDTESVELIRENGGLARLIAYITDTPAPEEEGDKKKAKGGEKGGKGGKGGKEKDDKGGKGGKGGGGASEDQEPTKTLPEVKEHAAKAIARAARNIENCKVLHESETEKMLILLLAHDDPAVTVAAAQAIGTMAQLALSKDSISGWEGMAPLVKMLTKEDNPDILEASTFALANLTTGSSHNCHEVVNNGGIESLVTLLGSQCESAVASVCCILTNMATEEDIRSEIQRVGVILSLIDPLTSSNTNLQSKACLAVASFILDSDTRTEFRNNDGLDPLVKLLNSGNSEVRRSASWALSVAAADEPTAQRIGTLGGIEVLQEIQQSTTRKNAFTDIALSKLMDYNLSAKYALTGHLGQGCFISNGFYDCGLTRAGKRVRALSEYFAEDASLFAHVDTQRILNLQMTFNNRVEDGFVDPGAMKQPSKLATLEDLCKQEVDRRRPIILVNAQLEQTRPLTPKSPEKDESMKSQSVKGKTTSKVDFASRGGKGQKEREERQREAEEEEQRQKEQEVVLLAALEREQTFRAPADPALVKYLEEITEKILPLPTNKEQFVELARFVAEKMGGPIPMGEVGTYSWELALSQIKYERRSNVIPIGLIKTGVHVHRALLYKALADRLGLPCSLERGDYNRAWNTILIFAAPDANGPKFPPRDYIVDLMHNPGRLMAADDPEAEMYKQI